MSRKNDDSAPWEAAIPAAPSVSLMDAPDVAPRLADGEELFLRNYGRQFGEKLTYSVGLAYSAGMIAGGFYGLVRGMGEPAATSRRRVNAVLNSCGRGGTALGGRMAIITMFYCTAGALVAKALPENSPRAAPLGGLVSGALYKCAGGWRAAGAYGLTSALAFTGIDKWLRDE